MTFLDNLKNTLWAKIKFRVSMKLFTVAGIFCLLLFAVFVFIFLFNKKRFYIHTRASNMTTEDFSMIVDVVDYAQKSIPVNTVVTLKFELTNKKPLFAGDEYCIEFPINRKGVYDQERNVLWDQLHIAPDTKEDSLKSRGAIKLVNFPQSTSWKEHLASNGLVTLGYCIELKAGALNSNSTIVISYTGKSQRLIRPLRFRARAKSMDGKSVIFKADNVLTFTPSKLYSFNVKLPFDTKKGKPISLKIAALDEFGNRKIDYVGTVHLASSKLIENLPSTITFTKNNQGYIEISNLKINSVGFVRIKVTDIVKNISDFSNFTNVQVNPKYYRLVGDTHFHTGYGLPEPFLKVSGDHIGNYAYGDELYGDYAYDYAEHSSLLDFVVHSEHVSNGKVSGGFVVSDPQHPEYKFGYSQILNNQLADKYYKSNKFTTFYGYEWGGNWHHPGGGHHIIITYNNVTSIFKASDSNIKEACTIDNQGVTRPCFTRIKQCNVSNQCANTRPKLINFLEQEHAEFIAIPHSMYGFEYDNHHKHVISHDPDSLQDYESHAMFDNYNSFRVPIGEIYSYHNDRDYRGNVSNAFGNEVAFYQYGWHLGHKIGVIGSSDNHYGTPGMNNFSNHIEEDGGLAVVLSSQSVNNRESVWAAMGARHTYGTSGSKIYLDFSANDYPMGSYFRTNQPPKFHIKVGATEKIERVQIFKIDKFTKLEDSQWDSFINKLDDFSNSRNDTYNDSNPFKGESDTYVVDGIEEHADSFNHSPLDQGTGEDDEDDDSQILYDYRKDFVSLIKDFSPNNASINFSNDGLIFETEFIDNNFSKSSMYYVRIVQKVNHHLKNGKGYEAAWSSPIWIDYGINSAPNREPYFNHDQWDIPGSTVVNNKYQLVMKDWDGVFSVPGGLDELQMVISDKIPTDTNANHLVVLLRYGMERASFRFDAKTLNLKFIAQGKNNPIRFVLDDRLIENDEKKINIPILKHGNKVGMASFKRTGMEFFRIDAMPNLGGVFETLVANFNINIPKSVVGDNINKYKLYVRLKDRFGSYTHWGYLKLRFYSVVTPTTTPTPTSVPIFTPTPTLTNTPTPTSISVPTPTLEPTPTLTPTQTPISTPTFPVRPTFEF